MWHCDGLERQTDGSAVVRFVKPGTKDEPARVRKHRYLGGADTPIPGNWYDLDEKTGAFERAVPTLPAAPLPAGPLEPEGSQSV